MPTTVVDIIMVVVWALVASVAMSCSLGILLTVYDKLTPGIEEFEELKKGNIAVAIVMAAVILAFAAVICVILWPGSSMVTNMH